MFNTKEQLEKLLKSSLRSEFKKTKKGGEGIVAKPKYKKWLTKEGLIKIEGWARDGLTNEQVAHNMGITRETLRVWGNKHSAISDALKKGKEVVDREVENALVMRALGKKEMVKKVKVLNNGEIVRYEEELVTPPDTTAIIFWLKNRKPIEWRDRRETEITGKDGGAIEIADARQILIEKLTKSK